MRRSRLSLRRGGAARSAEEKSGQVEKTKLQQQQQQHQEPQQQQRQHQHQHQPQQRGDVKDIRHNVGGGSFITPGYCAVS